MKNLIVQENDLRVESRKKNLVIDDCLLQMNLRLLSLEKEPHGEREYPTLFVFGLPRSGTTLCYQVIAQCLDLGYVDNLVARFWLAPQHGIALSKSVFGPLKEPRYESHLGRPLDPRGPHEFSYFWQHWLKIFELDDMLTFDRPKSEIDWHDLRQTIQGMQEAFEKGAIFKTSYVANHVQAFAVTFSKPLFLYIERDPTDIALSILAARVDMYGRKDVWWSNYPPDYRDLAELPFPQQIAGQVRSLRATYEREMRRLPSELVLRVNYAELCSCPGNVVAMVQDRVATLHGVTLDRRFASPERFAFKTRPATLDADQKAVAAAMMAEEG